MSDRIPILEYAAANPIPTYTAPGPPSPAVTVTITTELSVIISTEGSIDLETDALPTT